MHDESQNPGRGNKHNLEYSKVRQDFKNGDVVLYKGTSFVSKLIRKFTKSEYSHSGIVSWWNDRVMVMEAVGKGVVVTPLSRNVRKYHGDVDWYSCKNEVLDADRLRLVAFAQLGLGRNMIISSSSLSPSG